MADKVILLSDEGINMEVTSFPNKNKEMKAFMWNEIKSVEVEDDVTGFLFFKKPTEKIKILTTNPETPSYFNPVEFLKKNHEEHFEEYISELKKVSDKKSINFSDERK